MSTTTDLRKELFKQMKGLSCGTTSIKQARQSTKIASQIIYSLRVDIENKRENIKIMKALKSKSYKDIKPNALNIF